MKKLTFQMGFGLLLLVIGGLMLFKAWQLTRPESEQPERTMVFFKDQILPLVEIEEGANKKAIRSAQARSHEIFDRYRSRAPKFSDELVTLGTKWNLMKAALHDWWNKDNQGAQVAQKAFSETIFSEKEIKRALETLMNDFRTELEANRNIMLSQTLSKIKTSDVPFKKLSVDTLAQDFQSKAQDFLKERAKKIPQMTLLSASGGFAAGAGLTWLGEAVTVALIRWSATAAVSAGGATVAGGVGGGASGTAIGPWGTAAGVVTGVVIGYAADCWMESKFKEKMSKQTVDMQIGRAHV